MQSSHHEPGQRDFRFHHGKQYRQNCLPCCASCALLPHLLPTHVRPAARYPLPHTLCHRSGPILPNDTVSMQTYQGCILLSRDPPSSSCCLPYTCTHVLLRLRPLNIQKLSVMNSLCCMSSAGWSACCPFVLCCGRHELYRLFMSQTVRTVFSVCRDVAPRIGYLKPALIESRFFPALQVSQL